MSTHLADTSSGTAKPDSRLELLLRNLAGADGLVQALLRIDLGARINVDMSTGSLDIEGRFWEEDVISAIEALGCYIISVESKPRYAIRLAV
jgi:hypothetical protein